MGERNNNWCARNDQQRGHEEMEVVGREETIQTKALLSQNTEKSPGVKRRLVITLTSVKDHQLMLQ